MRSAAVNLQPLLTCPAFMLWHAVGGLLCLPSFLYALTSAGSYTGSYVSAYVVPSWSALVVTSLQRDLLLPPFSFTLPGHRHVLRRSLFLVGVVASLVAALAVVSHPGLHGLGLWAAVWSSFCFGLIVYQLAAHLLLVVPSVAAAVGPAILVAAPLIEFPSARGLVQDVALFSPGWNALVLAALSVLTWRRLGNVGLARRLCGERFLSLQRLWRRSAAEDFGAFCRRESLAKSTFGLRRWLLRKDFERIFRAPCLSLRRHLAATRYELSGRHLPLTAAAVIVAALLILVALAVTGYVPERESRPGVPMANIVYVLGCLVGLRELVPMHDSMLLPAGRREKFWTALAVAGCHGLMVLGVSLACYLTLLAMNSVAPPLTLAGKDLSFQPADLEIGLVPLIYLPWSMLVKLTCRRWLLVPEVILLGITAVVIVAAGGAFRALGPLALATPVVLSWALLVGVLGLLSFRRDLV